RLRFDLRPVSPCFSVHPLARTTWIGLRASRSVPWRFPEGSRSIADRGKNLILLRFPSAPSPSYRTDGLTECESHQDGNGPASLFKLWITGISESDYCVGDQSGGAS